MRNSRQKMLEGNYPVSLKWFLTLIPELITVETAAHSSEMFHHTTLYIFWHCLFRVLCLLHITKAERDPMLPLWLSYALMQTGLCCNQASNEPTGEFLGIVQGCSSRKTLNPSGFYFWAILVSWSGQSGTISPKERLRAWELCDFESEKL